MFMDRDGAHASLMMDVRRRGMNPHRQHHQDHEEVAEKPHRPSPFLQKKSHFWKRAARTEMQHRAVSERLGSNLQPLLRP